MDVDTSPTGEVVLLTGVRCGIDTFLAWVILPLDIEPKKRDRHVWRESRCIETGRMVRRQAREGKRIDPIDTTQ